jgi:hypothetical protein
MVKIHEGIGRPQPFLELLPRDQLAGAFHQHRENPKGLFLKVGFLAVGPELARSGIKFISPEAQEPPRISRSCHRGESGD